MRRGMGAVDLRFWLIQTFNGISYGALLFLLGSGLSLIFGVMRIVNLAHGSFFLMGGYVALSAIAATGSWVLAIASAALAFGSLRPALLCFRLASLSCQAPRHLWSGGSGR